MAGFLSGAIVGVVVAGVALGTASYMVDGRVELTRPPLDATPDATPGADPDTVPEDSETPDEAAPDEAAVPDADGTADVVALAAEPPSSDPATETSGSDVAEAPDAADTPVAEDTADTPAVPVAPGDGGTDDSPTEIALAPDDTDAPAAAEVVAEDEVTAGDVAADDVTADEVPAADETAEASGPDVASPPAETTDRPLVRSEEAFASNSPGLRLPVPDPEDSPSLPLGEEAAQSPEADAEVTGATDTPPEAAPVPDGPALTAFATPFELPPGTPVLSVLLIDTGAGERPDPASLANFPLPLTIGIDPTAPDAAEAMAAYRAAGHEVAVLADLPANADPDTVAAALEEGLNAVPQSVAVLDSPAATLQENRQRAQQVATLLDETGHGMITYQRGLNSGLQVVQSAGVPAIAVFRDFDDGVRNVSAMKRLLDVGAFRAAQEGAVVVTGTTRPESITALTEWVLSSRAATVALAPVSAVLRSQN